MPSTYIITTTSTHQWISWVYKLLPTSPFLNSIFGDRHPTFHTKPLMFLFIHTRFFLTCTLETHYVQSEKSFAPSQYYTNYKIITTIITQFKHKNKYSCSLIKINCLVLLSLKYHSIALCFFELSLYVALPFFEAMSLTFFSLYYVLDIQWNIWQEYKTAFTFCLFV